MKTLIHKKGNLLTEPTIDCLLHSCNVCNTFGAGIAKQIKDVYPEAYVADTEAAKSGSNKFGQISYTGVMRNNKPFAIFNLYAQDLSGSGRRTNYEALYQAMEKALFICNSSTMEPKPSIGIPRLMGAALGGGRWEIIERMIEVVFENYTGNVTIVEWDGTIG